MTHEECKYSTLQTQTVCRTMTYVRPQGTSPCSQHEGPLFLPSSGSCARQGTTRTFGLSYRVRARYLRSFPRCAGFLHHRHTAPPTRQHLPEGSGPRTPPSPRRADTDFPVAWADQWWARLSTRGPGILRHMHASDLPWLRTLSATPAISSVPPGCEWLPVVPLNLLQCQRHEAKNSMSRLEHSAEYFTESGGLLKDDLREASGASAAPKRTPRGQRDDLRVVLVYGACASITAICHCLHVTTKPSAPESRARTTALVVLASGSQGSRGGGGAQTVHKWKQAANTCLVHDGRCSPITRRRTGGRVAQRRTRRRCRVCAWAAGGGRQYSRAANIPRGVPRTLSNSNCRVSPGGGCGRRSRASCETRQRQHLSAGAARHHGNGGQRCNGPNRPRDSRHHSPWNFLHFCRLFSC